MCLEDSDIIKLYWQRDQRAVDETQRKYGALCRRIAGNILTLRQDAEECVNDVWFRAWDSIQPQRPVSMGPYLGRITRNLALDRWRRNRAQKRYAGMEQLLSELEECIPSALDVEGAAEYAHLTQTLNGWLAALPQEDRVLFVRRYWYGESLKALAAGLGITPGKLAQRMYRLREKLRAVLEREGAKV